MNCDGTWKSLAVCSMPVCPTRLVFLSLAFRGSLVPIDRSRFALRMLVQLFCRPIVERLRLICAPQCCPTLIIATTNDVVQMRSARVVEGQSTTNLEIYLLKRAALRWRWHSVRNDDRLAAFHCPSLAPLSILRPLPFPAPLQDAKAIWLREKSTQNKN